MIQPRSYVYSVSYKVEKLQNLVHFQYSFNYFPTCSEKQDQMWGINIFGVSASCETRDVVIAVHTKLDATFIYILTEKKSPLG